MKLHWQILVALGLGAKRNWHILFALIAGVLCGKFLQSPELQSNHIIHYVMGSLNFVGQLFINSIQMVVIPLVVSAIIVGIASLGDSKQLGKIGLKMVVYYSMITIIAVLIGSSLASVIKPGDNVQQYITAKQASQIQTQFEVAGKDRKNLVDQALSFIPKNPIKAFANGDLIPILVFVVTFGCALALIGDINRPVVSFFESIFAATMKVTDWIMVLATPGIFALTAFSIAKSGLAVFGHMSAYIATLMIGLLIQLFVTYPTMLKMFSKVSFSSLYRAVAEAMMVAFGTASSSATLPVTIACCERRAGISSKICSFVLPLGATMNMDGTAMFQTIAVMFIAQCYGVELTPLIIGQICLFAIVASSASAGIPSAGLITMALILNSLGLTPDQVIQGYTLIFTIDRILDMFRTLVNVTSDTVVASIIASNEGELDFDLLANKEVWKEVV